MQQIEKKKIVTAQFVITIIKDNHFIRTKQKKKEEKIALRAQNATSQGIKYLCGEQRIRHRLSADQLIYRV